ncbi:MAG TPA: dihydropteroate synthase, partial [Anaerolineales bacterium]|nr:dihydropteroate synthase [Anaerolineales bacterium]
MYLPNHFVWGTQTYLMGVINVTPDSFSGDGLGQKNELVTRALELATKFVEAGAHVIDVGGESTRPGNRPITVGQELDRVVPVVQALAENFSIPISVDTSKSIVADAALTAGASIVNDIWGLRQDIELANIISKHGSAVILMHNSSQSLDTESNEM